MLLKRRFPWGMLVTAIKSSQNVASWENYKITWHFRMCASLLCGKMVQQPSVKICRQYISCTQYTCTRVCRLQVLCWVVLITSLKNQLWSLSQTIVILVNTCQIIYTVGLWPMLLTGHQCILFPKGFCTIIIVMFVMFSVNCHRDRL